MHSTPKRRTKLLNILKWIIGVPTVLLVMGIVVTAVFGRIETKQFSAYAVCRRIALTAKGYGTWKYSRTQQLPFVAWVTFSDGTNDLTCIAKGIGPFWISEGYTKTLAGCIRRIDNGNVESCPEAYYGVSP